MKKIFYMIIIVLSLTACKERKEPHERGQFRNEKVYIINEEKPFTGSLVEEFENGQEASKMSYYNGVLDGEFIFYYEDGQIREKGRYKKYKIDGNFKSYYENGQLMEDISYRSGDLHGNYTLYYENGEVESKGDIKVDFLTVQSTAMI